MTSRSRSLTDAARVSTLLERLTPAGKGSPGRSGGGFPLRAVVEDTGHAGVELRVPISEGIVSARAADVEPDPSGWQETSAVSADESVGPRRHPTMRTPVTQNLGRALEADVELAQEDELPRFPVLSAGTGPQEQASAPSEMRPARDESDFRAMLHASLGMTLADERSRHERDRIPTMVNERLSDGELDAGHPASSSAFSVGHAVMRLPTLRFQAALPPQLGALMDALIEQLGATAGYIADQDGLPLHLRGVDHDFVAASAHVWGLLGGVGRAESVAPAWVTASLQGASQQLLFCVPTSVGPWVIAVLGARLPERALIDQALEALRRALGDA